MHAIGYAILLGFAGTITGALWTFAVGLAGTPGALIANHTVQKTAPDLIPKKGLAVTVLGQLYASLAFVSCVILTTRHQLATDSGFGKWTSFLVAFLVSEVPVWAALKDAVRGEDRTVQHLGMTFTAPLSTIGFFVLLLVPMAVSSLWPLVPTF